MNIARLIRAMFPNLVCFNGHSLSFKRGVNMWFENLIWKLYDVSTWLMKILYLNILWITFSLAGLIVGGFFPATAAMFTVSRKWLQGEKDIPLTKTFINAFKKSFLQINMIGFLLLLIGLVLYVDYRFFQGSENLILSFLTFPILLALFIYFIVTLFIFPVYVHYQFSTIQYIKHAFIMALGRPLYSIMMIVGSYFVYLAVSILPVLLLFASGSLLSIVLMWIAMKSFPLEAIEIDHLEHQKSH